MIVETIVGLAVIGGIGYVVYNMLNKPENTVTPAVQKAVVASAAKPAKTTTAKSKAAKPAAAKPTKAAAKPAKEKKPIKTAAKS